MESFLCFASSRYRLASQYWRSFFVVRLQGIALVVRRCLAAEGKIRAQQQITYNNLTVPCGSGVRCSRSRLALEQCWTGGVVTRNSWLLSSSEQVSVNSVPSIEAMDLASRCRHLDAAIQVICGLAVAFCCQVREISVSREMVFMNAVARAMACARSPIGTVNGMANFKVVGP